MPKHGPSEGSRRQMIAFLPMRLSASPRPMVVVVLPSPASVGLIAVTRMSLPSGLSARLRRKSYSSLAIDRPNGCRADSGAPIFAAISAIGLRRVARAISTSDRIGRSFPAFPPPGGRGRQATNRLAHGDLQARFVAGEITNLYNRLGV